jgi:WD40 repeat protein
MVSVSPSERYIIYCAAEGVVNIYGLYIYDTQTKNTVQLIGAANEELLNDLAWNISWSPKENYIAVSDKLILDVSKGSVAAEINASTIAWSPSGGRAAYVKQDAGANKTLCVVDLDNALNYEAFVCNQDEFLPEYMVWNRDETKIAIVTAVMDKQKYSDIYQYKAIYSLDLTSKEAKRIDTAMKLDEALVALLENMQYNDSGSLLSFTITGSTDSNLYVYNLNTSAYEMFYDVEYLHNENNESYVCSARNNLYFVQGSSIMELGESLESKVVKSSEAAIDDIYISQDGNAMVVVENKEEVTVLRQLMNFSNPI